jgi:hypothetical protein
LASEEEPFPEGPRQWDQFPANAMEGSRRRAEQMREIRYDMIILCGNFEEVIK